MLRRLTLTFQNLITSLVVSLFSSLVHMSFYSHMPIGKVWIYRLLFFILCVCLFVWLRISPPSIKLAASNFARRFIGVQGGESPILGNKSSP